MLQFVGVKINGFRSSLGSQNFKFCVLDLLNLAGEGAWWSGLHINPYRTNVENRVSS